MLGRSPRASCSSKMSVRAPSRRKKNARVKRPPAMDAAYTVGRARTQLPSLLERTARACDVGGRRMALHTRMLNGVGVLVAVVEAGTFVRAAEALGLTQSGVSRAIARLQEAGGVRLLPRRPRGAG